MHVLSKLQLTLSTNKKTNKQTKRTNGRLRQDGVQNRMKTTSTRLKSYTKKTQMVAPGVFTQSHFCCDITVLF